MPETKRHYYTLLGGFLALVLFAFFFRAVTPAPAADPYLEFIKTHRAFDEAFVEWTDASNKLLINADKRGISPYSLDLRAEIRVEWMKREVGEKFRKLERVMEGR